MKHPILLVLVAAILAGCSKPATVINSTAPETTSHSAPPAEYPTLVIDERHEIQDSNHVVSYQIPTTLGIRLDISHLHFTDGTNDVTPNMVSLRLGGAHYKLVYPAETNLYVIDGASLQVLRGGQFSGFNPGDHGTLFIGRLTADAFEQETLWFSWSGEIEVK